MKRSILLGVLFTLLLSSFFIGYERIDAGHAGVKFNLYGDDKGVDDVEAVSGANWYFKPTTDIFEVPTFVQNAVYTRDDHEGSESNEEFRITTKNGLVVSFDVSMNYYTPQESVIKIFKKYRKPIKTLEATIIRNYLRDAFNSTAANYTADELYAKRNKFQTESEDKITELLAKEGFVVEQVVLLNELRLPPSVVKNIEAKINASQQALRKKEELNSAKADADKRVAKARGDSLSMVIEAAGKAAAYKMEKRELTPDLLQKQFIEKWDGKLPVYGEVPKLFKTIK